jgi:glucose-1-phosphate adenylyltransferase
LQVLPPFERDEKKSKEKGGFAAGNADAIFRQLELIEEFNPDVLIVMSADHVYKFDFRDALETHFQKKASLTMVTTRLPKGENASRFGVVEAAKNGRVKNFQYKPEKPKTDLITTEIFVYEARVLIETLKKLKETRDELKDYGDELIPFLVKQGNVFEHRLQGYWRDVGTIKSYWQSQMDLLDEQTKFVFDDDDWRILTLAAQRAPAFIYGSADVKNSLIAQGCRIYGRVSRSILSSGVTVEKGAEVKDSIVLPKATIEKNVKIERVIVDAGVKLTVEKMKKIEAARASNKNAIVVVGKHKVQSEKEIKE